MEWVDKLFPNGVVIDSIMWLTIPLWILTLITVNKNKFYWLGSMIVCIIWAIFDYYIEAWHGTVLNLMCTGFLYYGYRRFKNGSK